jgi:hypothetical protein
VRYALCLHAYTTMKAAEAAAPGGALPRTAPALVSAAAPPPPGTPKGGAGGARPAGPAPLRLAAGYPR